MKMYEISNSVNSKGSMSFFSLFLNKETGYMPHTTQGKIQIRFKNSQPINPIRINR